MPIPESQFETWSHVGSVQQSSSTYQTIKRVLEETDSGYYDKSFEIFLQGSYGNDTNIYAESDVDVVIQLNSIYRGGFDSLSEAEKQAYRSNTTNATYSFSDFKNTVVAHLQKRFGYSVVSVGNKAVKIKAEGNRRSADVVVCFQYRRYKSFSTYNTEDFVPGIIFPTPSGDIINYPKKHSENLTTQHQATGNMLKPMARILKNMRNRMVDDGKLRSGAAPSYYLEGLFYNVPPDQYVSNSYGDTFCNGINWLLKADKKKLVCANYQYYLLGNTNVQWNETDFDAFLAAVCKLWKEW